MCTPLYALLLTLSSYLCAPARPPMRRYESDLGGPARLDDDDDDDDAGYVADSSSPSSECGDGDGEERPLLGRETEWWASAAPSANASVETVVAVGGARRGREAGVAGAGPGGACGVCGVVG